MAFELADCARRDYREPFPTWRGCSGYIGGWRLVHGHRELYARRNCAATSGHRTAAIPVSSHPEYIRLS